tara:strand:+ start:739 stop:885 length:147 start_codon:yes stop_codon:yes gene_type:complete
MGKYLCINCNYRFERDEVYDCPNCGESSIEKEKSAKELLEDVEGLLKD